MYITRILVEFITSEFTYITITWSDNQEIQQIAKEKTHEWQTCKIFCIFGKKLAYVWMAYFFLFLLALMIYLERMVPTPWATYRKNWKNHRGYSNYIFVQYPNRNCPYLSVAKIGTGLHFFKGKWTRQYLKITCYSYCISCLFKNAFFP